MSGLVLLRYQDTTFDAIQTDGQTWLRVGQLAPPLGYAHERDVRKLHERNPDEFTSDETRLMTVETDGGPQQVRVFSLRGVRLLALLARTEPARAFRRWVLDLLEGRVRPRGAAGAWGKPGLLTSDAKRALEAAMGLIEADHPAQAALRQIVSSGAGLPDDPTLDAHAAAWQANADRQRAISREYARLRHLAARDGYSEEAVKAQVRRRMRGGQAQLAFVGEEHAHA